MMQQQFFSSFIRTRSPIHSADTSRTPPANWKDNELFCRVHPSRKQILTSRFALVKQDPSHPPPPPPPGMTRTNSPHPCYASHHIEAFCRSQPTIQRDSTQLNKTAVCPSVLSSLQDPPHPPPPPEKSRILPASTPNKRRPQFPFDGPAAPLGVSRTPRTGKPCTKMPRKERGREGGSGLAKKHTRHTHWSCSSIGRGKREKNTHTQAGCLGVSGGAKNENKTYTR